MPMLRGRIVAAAGTKAEDLKPAPDAEWVLFEESSHCPHVEERERYMQVVGDWLARHD